MFQTKSVEKVRTHFMLNSFFFFTENGTVYEIVGKYGRAGQDTDDIIRRMRFACWNTEATHTHTQAVLLFFMAQEPLERQGPPCYRGFTI